MEAQKYIITVKLLKDTQLKGVRAYMVLAKLQEFGTVIATSPEIDLLEKGDFGSSFEVSFSSNETEQNIIDDISGISEVEEVIVDIATKPPTKATSKVGETNREEVSRQAKASKQAKVSTETKVSNNAEPTYQAESTNSQVVANKTTISNTNSMKKPEVTKKVEVEKKYIVFQIGVEEYALPIEYVMSIERSIKITRIPNVSNDIVGVCNLRGIVIPIVDLKYKFSREKLEINEATRIIVCRYENIEIGFFVDSAKEVLTAHDKYVEMAPDIQQSEATEYIKSLIHLNKRIIILLDVEKLFGSADKLV